MRPGLVFGTIYTRLRLAWFGVLFFWALCEGPLNCVIVHLIGKPQILFYTLKKMNSFHTCISTHGVFLTKQTTSVNDLPTIARC